MQDNLKTNAKIPEFSLIHWPFPTYKGDCILKQKKALTNESKRSRLLALQQMQEAPALF